MSYQEPGGQGREPSEEELRAAMEEQMRRIRVQDVLLQTVATLVNLGGRRLGLAPEAEDERDLDQARLAIEGTRALAPLLGPEETAAVRDALSQLQMAYAREAGEDAPAGAPGGGPGGQGPPPPPGPGPGGEGPPPPPPPGGQDPGAPPRPQEPGRRPTPEEVERERARQRIWTPRGS
jgi:hypothetical protein